LNGGKLCEVALSILRGYVDGQYPKRAGKPKNFLIACSDLEKANSLTFPRTVRIQIPRVLIALYEVRNNRGVGHVGGDVDPNHMDAVFVLFAAKWIVAELIRLFHDLDPEEAARAVDALVEREVPLIWEVNGKRRVLATQLPMKEKMLLLLYGSPSAIDERTIIDWLEHSNPSVFRRDVLRSAHRAKLLEYDSDKATVVISPSGVAFVEDRILSALQKVGT